MSRWYRAYTGTVKDDKLAEVAVIAGCSRSVAIAVWHSILESAAETDDGGRFETTPRRVAAALSEPALVIEAAFSAMTEIGMVEADAIPAWKKRQYESDKSTERSRKHRETKRNADATLHDRCATPPDTETETEEDNKAIALSSDPVAEMVDAYHEAMAPAGCPRVLKLTSSRKASALQRLKDCGGMDGWRRAMAKARASPFLTGASANGWKADFDFFMQAKSFTKLLEGSYDARNPGNTGGKPRPGADVAIDVANELLGRGRDVSGGAPELADALDAERDRTGLYRISGPADRGGSYAGNPRSGH